MGKLFTDFSYNNKSLKPLAQPINELKALYEKKDKDYNYVLDATNKIDSALKNMPHLDKDKELVTKAQDHFKTSVDGFGHALEDKIVDTKKLATDIDSNYGLSKIKKSQEARSTYLKELQERYDKGEITKERMINAVKYSDENYKGIQKDADTGLFTGGYSGRNVADYINVGDKVLKVLDGFKANEFPLKWQGKEIVKVPNGEGYMMAGTGEKVSEEDLIKAAKDYIKQDKQVQEQFNEDIFYETYNKDIKLNDVKNLLANGSSSKDVLNKLGIKTAKDLDTLEERLAENGLDLTDAYATIRKDQLTNEAISAGVEKESYYKYGRKYMKPLDLDGSSSSAKIQEGLLTSITIGKEQLISPKDFTRIKEGKQAAIDKQTNLASEVAKFQKQYNENPDENSKAVLEAKKEELKRLNYTIKNYKDKERSLVTHLKDKLKNSNLNLDKQYDAFKYNRSKDFANAVEEETNKRLKSLLQGLPNANPGMAIFKSLLASAKLAGENSKEFKELQQKVQDTVTEEFKKKEEFKIPSKEEFEFAVSDNYFSDKGYSLLRRSVNSNSSDLDDYSKVVAGQISKTIGKGEDLKLIDDVDVIMEGSISSKENAPYKRLMNIVDQAFKTAPHQFKVNEQSLDVYLQELDDYEQLDLTKAKIYPVKKPENGLPTYMVSVPYRFDKDEGNQKPINIKVNFESKGHGDLIGKVMKDEAKNLINKKAKFGKLEKADKDALGDIAQSYIISTGLNDRIDKLFLPQSETNKPIPLQVTDNLHIFINPKKSESNARYGTNVFEIESFDEQQGSSVLAKDDTTGKTGFVPKGSLNENYTSITFNNDTELKQYLGILVLKNEIKK